MRISSARRGRLARACACVLGVSIALGAGEASAQTSAGVSANGLHYRTEGRGPDVVLIHAFHMDLREWDDVVDTVAQSRRVLRYDVRGHGRSKVTAPLPSSIVDLLSLLDELKISRATLVGVSMGSTIALDFALTHPERVDGIILLSPAASGIKASTSLEWMQPIVAAVKGGNPQRAAELWWESPLLTGVRQRAPDAARYRSVVMDNAPVWTISAPPPQLDPPAGTRLNEVKVPVLAVAGELDRSGSLDAARIIGMSAPHGRTIEIAGAGHMLAIEKPVEVSRLILSAFR